jgi:hypothetical protein
MCVRVPDLPLPLGVVGGIAAFKVNRSNGQRQPQPF